MRTTRPVFAALLSLSAIVVLPTVADDGITLRIDHGAQAGSSVLSWTGSNPNFDVFRASNPATVSNGGNVVAILGGRTFTDNVLPPLGAGFFYLVTSVGPCSPRDPATVCGPGARCYPSQESLTYCSGPVGTGTQCAFCSSDANCSAVSLCVPTFSASCMNWCRIGFPGDCAVQFTCTALSPKVYAGAQEYGVCLCQ